jgi:transposase
MSNPENITRTKRVMHMVEVEGRRDDWIAEKEGVSVTMIRKIKHREWAKRAIAQKGKNES